MKIKDLTAVITTFKSEDKIHSCIKSLPGNIEIFVIENSSNKKFQDEIESKYPNVKCFLTGGNKGYSVANNLGLTKVNSRYALVMNPDTLITKYTIENFFKCANENSDFWLIGPGNNQSKEIKKNKDSVFEVENLKGFAIFFNLKKFKNNFFDENFFLYFEEIDLCKKVIKKKGKILIDNNIIIIHEGAGSVNKKYKEILEKNRNWHWMWSTFYYHKKYKGFFIALIIIFPKLLSSLIKIIYYQTIFNKKKRDIYFHRLSGIINSIIGKKSWYRPTLD